MRQSHRFAVTSGVLAALSIAPLGMTSPASAASTSTTVADQAISTVLSSPHPKAAYNALSIKERAAFDFKMLPASTTEETSFKALDATAKRTASHGGTPQEFAAAARGCWEARAKGKKKSNAGNVLYTYWIEGKWCWSGSRVTSAKVLHASGETSTLGWRYEGRSTGKRVSNNTGFM